MDNRSGMRLAGTSYSETHTYLFGRSIETLRHIKPDGLTEVEPDPDIRLYCTHDPEVTIHHESSEVTEQYDVGVPERIVPVGELILHSTGQRFPPDEGFLGISAKAANSSRVEEFVGWQIAATIAIESSDQKTVSRSRIPPTGTSDCHAIIVVVSPERTPGNFEAHD